MNDKRFNIEFDGHQYFLVVDEDNERCLARLDTRMDALAWLEMYKMLSEENEHIKQTIKDMINTERTEIGKMTLRQLWRQIQ